MPNKHAVHAGQYADLPVYNTQQHCIALVQIFSGSRELFIFLKQKISTQITAFSSPYIHKMNLDISFYKQLL